MAEGNFSPDNNNYERRVVVGLVNTLTKERLRIAQQNAVDSQILNIGSLENISDISQLVPQQLTFLERSLSIHKDDPWLNTQVGTWERYQELIVRDPNSFDSGEKMKVSVIESRLISYPWLKYAIMARRMGVERPIKIEHVINQTADIAAQDGIGGGEFEDVIAKVESSLNAAMGFFRKLRKPYKALLSRKLRLNKNLLRYNHQKERNSKVENDMD